MSADNWFRRLPVERVYGPYDENIGSDSLRGEELRSRIVDEYF